MAVTPIHKQKPEESGLLARLAGTPPRSRRPVCHTGVLLGRLPQDEADALRAALGNEDWTAKALMRLLVAEGHEITDQSLSRHRKGDCKCSHSPTEPGGSSKART